MTTVLVVIAPLAAALLTMLFRPLDVRRIARIVLAVAAAALPLSLVGRADWLSLLFAGIVSVIGFLATVFSTGMYSVDWGRGRAMWTRKSVYFVLLGTFWSAMLLVVLATNFGALWFGIAATTLATAFLVGFSGDVSALEAAWKYLVLCSVGIGLALLGIVLLGRVSLELGLDPAHALEWSAIAQHHLTKAAPPAALATAIMLIGFATKAGLVPMHAWLPDAHSKAPAPISALLSGVLVSCSLYAIVRTLSVAETLGAGDTFRQLLLAFGVASIVVAGALMLVQRDLKRLLAYSTVEHAGIVALALGFGGPLGLTAALLHLVGHAFAKSAAFFAAGLVQSASGSTALSALNGQWNRGLPGRFLLGALVALGGLPPFALFVSELLVVAAGIAAHQWLALGMAALGVMLAFAALARAGIAIESGDAARESGVRLGEQPSGMSIGAAAAALVCAAALAVVPWTGALR
ncbi:MAG: proton-conducting transporter membrane subunit [Candidatus Lustribacter sp.]|jgi:hydrogenase-4 component F